MRKRIMTVALFAATVPAALPFPVQISGPNTSGASFSNGLNVPTDPSFFVPFIVSSTTPGDLSLSSATGTAQGIFTAGPISGIGTRTAPIAFSFGLLLDLDTFAGTAATGTIQSSPGLGITNFEITALLTGLSYSGSSVNLQELASQGAAVLRVSWAGPSDKSLDSILGPLASDYDVTDGFTVTIESLPEPRFYGLLGAGLGAMLFAAKRRRRA
ncbi:MAG: hypothetical protein U0Q16_09615 [Bryobacteraceae bacterium]